MLVNIICKYLSFKGYEEYEHVSMLLQSVIWDPIINSSSREEARDNQVLSIFTYQIKIPFFKIKNFFNV